MKPRTPPSNPPRPNRAFIGISLDSKGFSRIWVREALKLILKKHDQLLIVIADDLFWYTRSLHQKDGENRLALEECKSRIAKRRGEAMRFLSSEINKLSCEDQEKIEIRSWNYFADGSYADLLRKLKIAFLGLPDFNSSVKSVASRHAHKITSFTAHDIATDACTEFLLDETAMCVRITEIEGYCNEYYPGEDIAVLGNLYAGEWAHLGLDVGALTGAPSKRIFTNLKIDD